MKYYIGVAAHKPYLMPNLDIYHPVQVGAALHSHIEGYDYDDEGHNISKLNANYSELTGLYYIWKNVNSQYKGLVHYRRYLGKRRFTSSKNKLNSILSEKDLDQLFMSTDVVVPRSRKYYIESNYSHYIHAHQKKDLTATRDIIQELYPEYLVSFDKHMQLTKAHMFNMFVMKSKYFDLYCEWLFSVLFKLQETIDISEYSTQESRVFGYVSELLLDVWLDTNNVKIFETPVIYVENQHLMIKAIRFLKRKYNKNGESHIRSSID